MSGGSPKFRRPVGRRTIIRGLCFVSLSLIASQLAWRELPLSREVPLGLSGMSAAFLNTLWDFGKRRLHQANESAGRRAAALSFYGGVGDSCKSVQGVRFRSSWDLVSESLSYWVLRGLGSGDTGGSWKLERRVPLLLWLCPVWTLPPPPCPRIGGIVRFALATAPVAGPPPRIFCPSIHSWSISASQPHWSVHSHSGPPPLPLPPRAICLSLCTFAVLLICCLHAV